MKSIRALTFDLDNTLWETDESILIAEEAMAAHLRSLTPPAWMTEFGLEAFRAVRQQIIEERPDIAHNLTLVRQETLIRWFEIKARQDLSPKILRVKDSAYSTKNVRK